MADVVPEAPPAANRGLWMLVIGLGIAILLVVAAMIGMAVRQSYKKPPDRTEPSQATLTPGDVPELNLDLEPGATVSDARMEGSSLVVRISSTASEEVLVIDPAKSKVISRIRFNRKTP